MRLNVTELNDALVSSSIPSVIENVKPLGDFLRVSPEHMKEAVRIAKTRGGYTYYIDVFGVDTEEGVDVVVHLRSFDPLTDLYFKSLLTYGGTWTSIWEDFPAAMMPERELCEMFGLKLAGHPNPKRLLTTDALPPMLLKSEKIRTMEEVHEK